MATEEERANIMAEYLANVEEEEEEEFQDEDDGSEHSSSSSDVPIRTKRQKILFDDESDDEVPKGSPAEYPSFQSKPRIMLNIKDAEDMNSSVKHDDADQEGPTNDEDVLLYWNQWYDSDMHFQRKLWKKHQCSTYAWDKTKFDLTTTPQHELIGDYDILFCHGEPVSTDQGWTDDFPISRTIRGTLTIEHKSVDKDNRLLYDRSRIVGGTIHVEPSITREYPNNQWEYYLQTNQVLFQESPFGDSDSFNLKQLEGTETDEECNEQVYVNLLQNSGRFKWIPVEANRNREGCHKFLHSQLLANNLIWCKPEDSWLVHHLKLPPKIAQRIHRFLQVFPAGYWEWNSGDLLIELRPVDYATSWITHYIARKQV